MGAREHDPLSRDVDRLGRLLGEGLTELEGADAFRLVEEYRAGTKSLRARDPWPHDFGSAGEELFARTAALTLDQARLLVRAFSSYFHLVNLAEERHRLRVLRHRQQEDPDAPRPESLDAAVAQAARAGVTAPRALALLADMVVEPVFTAHPTEARRRTVQEKLRRLERLVDETDDARLSPREQAAAEGRVREEIAALWLTEEVRPRPPSVIDEVRNGLLHFEHALWHVVPRLHRDLQAALARAFPGHTATTPDLVRFGSWIGGDRDGNPNVTAAVTERTLRLHRDTTLRLLQADVLALQQHLSVRLEDEALPAPLQEALARADRLLPELADRARAPFAGEPYRRLTAVMLARLRATRRSNTERLQQLGRSDPDLQAEVWGEESGREPSLPGDVAAAYGSAQEALADARALVDGLRAQGLTRLAEGSAADLVTRLRVFGFHLARLDLRQHSAVHEQAMAEVLRAGGRHADYAALGEEDRVRLLSDVLDGAAPALPPADWSPATRETLALFQAEARLRLELAPEAIGPYVISMTDGLSDMLEPLALAHLAGGPPRAQPLDVVPLFETIDDLRRCASLMRALFALPAYARHLAARRGRQQVMLGYSDSNKDGGFVTANWHLYRAQEELSAACRDAGVDLTLFHGRGGAIGRGGGPAQRAILAQPPGTVHGRLRLTEQGEVAFARYGHPDIAHRHLEQMLHAVVTATVRDELGAAVTPPVPWREAMERLAGVAFAAYRALVYERPEFIDAFHQATPIDVISALRIGSRPARRKGSDRLEDLRAIPWVFSWTQSRHGLPGWYGLGTALHRERDGRDADGAAALRGMYDGWPFFRSLIDNAQLSLGKADRAVARLYERLAEPRVREAVFTRVHEEWDRTLAAVADLTGDDLLEDSPVLRRSIRLRNPYVDPLSLVQVALLARLRALPEDDPRRGEVQRVVALSINGVAAGLQNTG
jgi:phosphoenolpyruvate carboxylase